MFVDVFFDFLTFVNFGHIFITSTSVLYSRFFFLMNFMLLSRISTFPIKNCIPVYFSFGSALHLYFNFMSVGLKFRK
jgi:hypothetical protein